MPFGLTLAVSIIAAFVLKQTDAVRAEIWEMVMSRDKICYLSCLSGSGGVRQRAQPLAVLAAIGLAFVAVAGEVRGAENPEISMKRSTQRLSFTNEEIIDGFYKIAFGAELQLDQPVERIRKFDGPVRVFVINQGGRDRLKRIAAVVGDIRARVNHLDIAMTEDRRAANLIVRLVPKRNFKQTLNSLYGPERSRQIQQSLNPQCLSGIGKDASYRIQRAEVLLPVDADEFAFSDCAYEELLQALGPINDDASVPWTMFNDEVQMGFFDIYDQYLLNILYDPRVRPGMTKKGVAELTPEVMPAVRAWVASNNPPPTPRPRGGSTSH
jgi:hypothetical protein